MKNEANNRGNVYQMVTDRIIAQMEHGIVPWHKPWTGAAKNAKRLNDQRNTMVGYVFTKRQ